jgi:lipopolysaccharide transport system ATP-binding protein
MYKLGQIGGGSLQADLQSWWARKRGKEDPNTKIGQGKRLVGQTFMALNGIDLTIYQGESLGIIGGNGAGKSTMLKLLSRVTAPSDGKIQIYGRVASMLEVGTGFNGEMTGRENIYMNGAILGMSKEEIDSKMEDIIEFSEVREFIDTPVKRYSSGMYVKLAFSVAAHLDSEIMIMDEVLAVGDVAFQNKCIEKMRDVANKEGRTVLYVSHNMNTIRQLCSRCIVMDKGKIIYEGDVEEAINIYSNSKNTMLKMEYNTDLATRVGEVEEKKIYIKKIYVKNSSIKMNENFEFSLDIQTNRDIKEMFLRCVISSSTGEVLGIVPSEKFSLDIGDNLVSFSFLNSELSPGTYTFDIVISEYNGSDYITRDSIFHTVAFMIEESCMYYNMGWQKRYWGNIFFNSIKVKNRWE